jgi:hypothetical protein
LGKKRQRTKYVSKGERKPIDPRWRKEYRREYNGSTAQMQNKLEAWLKGKKVMLTIENPNKNETNKKFIRVNANNVWRRKTA